MTVAELFENQTFAPEIAPLHIDFRDNAKERVSAVCFDSRKLSKGCVFVAVRGTSFDGHRFVTAAIESKAAAIVVEDEAVVPQSYRGAVAVVASSRATLSFLAARFYGRPSQNLFSVGITGTNGKTTSAYMVEAVLSSGGLPTGVIGTIDSHLRRAGNVETWPTETTTPDPVTFQERLAEFVKLGARAVALEASSHALEQCRIEAAEFDCAVFTNLTRDHLDYHASMDEYFRAKSILFTKLLWRSRKTAKTAIVNVGDPWGKLLAAELGSQLATQPKSLALWRFCESGQNQDLDGVEFVYQILDIGFNGSLFRLQTPLGEADFQIRMPGRHNVANAVGAIAVGLAAGLSLERCAKALKELAGVPGRLEAIVNKKERHVFVDFAHTASALEGALSFLGAIGKKKARIITVFGCGGDRDKGKRPLMMQAALSGSDIVVLTSDNPRSENPETIMDDALLGAQNSGAQPNRIYREVDRRKAIGLAIGLAREGDVVLIAGKGHEAYQQIGNEKKPFSDQETARDFLK